MSRGLLHPLHIANQKWEEISMDFIEGLPMSDGNDMIFIVVDRLTKYAHFMGLKKTYWKNNNLLKRFAKIFIN